MPDYATALESLAGQTFLITTQPEILDFTNPGGLATLVIIVKGQRFDIPLPHNRLELIKTLGFLKVCFAKSKLLLAWNIKNLFSYFRAITGKELEISVPIIDLKVLEAFLGISEPCPTLFKHAKNRLEVVTANSSWDQLKIIYKSIHTPLIQKVIPQIETLGLVDTNQKTILHPCYEIEGQVNGRLRCTSAFRHSFNPHTFSESEKQCLTTPDFDDKEFICFDFKHMEVAVLQWLSQDKVLGNILQQGRDVYELIWEMLTGLECSPSRRKICKTFFLPVVFGQGAPSLAEKTGITEDTAKKLVSCIYKTFSTAMAWVSKKDINSNKMAVDYYGRWRKFEDEYYRTQLRNFHVQAPASIICLHKLTKLSKIGRICFHVHDGYAIMGKKGQEGRILSQGREILEAEDELYPGLRLKVAAYRGANLNELYEVK
jgi:hypothetical protein